MNEDPRSPRAHANAPPHLVERGVLEKPNVDGFLLAPAQTAHGIAKGRIRLAALRYIHPIRGCHATETKTRPSALTALMVAGQVDDRLVQPGAERVHLARRSRGEPDTHKRLLNDVLSDGVVADEQGCQLNGGAIQRQHQRLDPGRLRRLYHESPSPITATRESSRCYIARGEGRPGAGLRTEGRSRAGCRRAAGPPPAPAGSWRP